MGSSFGKSLRPEKRSAAKIADFPARTVWLVIIPNRVEVGARLLRHDDGKPCLLAAFFDKLLYRDTPQGNAFASSRMRCPASWERVRVGPIDARCGWASWLRCLK